MIDCRQTTAAESLAGSKLAAANDLPMFVVLIVVKFSDNLILPEQRSLPSCDCLAHFTQA